jgi:undecaprenol kinase
MMSDINRRADRLNEGGVRIRCRETEVLREEPYPEVEASIGKSRSVAQSFTFASQGIQYAITHERNMRVHLAVAILALLACALLRCTLWEWCLVIMLVGLVLAGEMLNTVVETIVDLIEPTYHERVKIIKDVAAGAVLIFACVALTVGLMVYINALLRLIG